MTEARDHAYPAVFLQLGNTVICTSTWTARYSDGAPADGCARRELQVLANLATASSGVAAREAIAASVWGSTTVDPRTITNTIGRALRWGEEQGALRRHARAAHGVYRIDWQQSPRWRSSPPWNHAAQLDSLRQMLAGSPLPTCVTDYCGEPISMNVVWANPAYLHFVDWSDPSGRTVQDIVDRLVPIIDAAHREACLAEQASIMQRLLDGVDLH